MNRQVGVRRRFGNLVLGAVEVFPTYDEAYLYDGIVSFIMIV